MKQFSIRTISWLIFLFIFGLFFLPQTQVTAVGVCPSDESASQIEAGDVIEGRVRTNQEDWYFFEGEEGDIWRIEMIGDSEDIFNLGILDPEARLNEDYDSSDFFFEYRVNDDLFNSAFRTRSEGIYCLRVWNESDGGSINYEISLEPFTIRSGEIRNTDDLDSYGTNTVGIWYYERSDYETAFQLFVHSVELNPEDAVINRNACTTAFNLGQYQDGIPYCDNAIELVDAFVVAYDYRSASYRAIGLYEDAESDYSALIDLEPDEQNWYFQRGVNYLLMGDGDAALDDFDDYLVIGDIDSPYFRGLAYLIVGDYNDALDDFESSVEALDDSKNNTFYPLVWQAVVLDLDGGREKDIDNLLDAAADAAEDFEDDLAQIRAFALTALIRGNIGEAQGFYQQVLEDSSLAADRTFDLLYLSLIAELYPDNLSYFAILEWFKAELVFD
jgi:tetratricopeptide (TPR) repeat protein